MKIIKKHIAHYNVIAKEEARRLWQSEHKITNAQCDFRIHNECRSVKDSSHAHYPDRVQKTLSGLAKRTKGNLLNRLPRFARNDEIDVSFITLNNTIENYSIATRNSIK